MAGYTNKLVVIFRRAVIQPKLNSIDLVTSIMRTGFRQRLMKECHCLETDIKRDTDFAGSLGSMWEKGMSGGSAVVMSSCSAVRACLLQPTTGLQCCEEESYLFQSLL